MAFKTGHKKAGGRKKGTPNETTKELRGMISDFLIENFPKIIKDFNKLPPKEKAKLYCDLLQYGLPKLQNVGLETTESGPIVITGMRIY